MRMFDTARFSLRGLVAGLALVPVLGMAAGANSETGKARGDTYEWSAVLQSVDVEAGTAVLQARIEGFAEIEGLDSHIDGDRLTLVWTGRLWASGIRGLAADPEISDHTLALPVEFVSTADDGRYLNFRVPVPDEHLAEIAAMDSGTRVTGVSPREMGDWHNSVLVLRHYNAIE